MEHAYGCCGACYADSSHCQAEYEPKKQAWATGCLHPGSLVRNYSTSHTFFESNTAFSVCVTSIERLISLNFNATFAKDFTWATGTSVIWTQVESTVGVICACAPSLRAPLARFVPILFGASGKEDSYELSDAVPHHLGPRSGNWTDQSKSSKGSRKRGELDTVDILETRTTLRGDGSQEQIVGIKKTVSFDMTYTERSEEMMTEEGKETYPKYQYDRHVV